MSSLNTPNLEKNVELVQCIYCSASAPGAFGRNELPELLEECRTNNAKCDITGILLYHNQSFFQVLEGDRSVVEALFEKVASDSRHTRVTRDHPGTHLRARIRRLDYGLPSHQQEGAERHSRLERFLRSRVLLPGTRRRTSQDPACCIQGGKVADESLMRATPRVTVEAEAPADEGGPSAVAGEKNA